MKTIILFLAFFIVTPSQAAVSMRLKADQVPSVLKTELESAGFVIVSMKNVSWRKAGNERRRIVATIVTFDHDLDGAETSAVLAVVDAHEGNTAKKARLKIIIKNLTKLLQDEPATLQRVANLLVAVVISERLDE